MSKYTLVLIGLFSCSLHVFGQTNLSFTDQISQAEDLHASGVASARKQKFAEAIAFYDKAYQQRLGLIEQIDYFTESERERFLTGFVKTLHNLGVAFAYQDDLKKAEYYTSLCIARQLEFQEKYDFLLPLRLGRAYCQLGKVYVKTKGFDQAYMQLSLGEFYLLKVQPKPKRDLSLLENTYSNLFLIWEEADSLYGHSQEQLKLQDENQQGFSTASIYINLGVSQEMRDELASALEYFDRALKIYLQDSITYQHKIGTIYQDKAYVFAKQKKWLAAENSIDEAIEIYKSRPASNQRALKLATLFGTKAFIGFLKEDYPQAVKWYDRAIKEIALDGESDELSSVEQLTAGDAFIPVDKSVILFAIGYKGKALHLNGNIREARSAFTLAINYLNKIRREYNDTESKLKLTEIAKVIFEGAIALHLDPAVNEPEKAFAYAEQSKAFTLLEGIKHSKAMRIAQVPDELLEQEYELRGKIARLERKYLATKEPEEKTEYLQNIRKQKEELIALMTRLQKNKEYRKLMSFEAPSIRALQRRALGSGQTLVEYFVGEEKTYVFVLPKKGSLKVLELNEHSKSLNQVVDQFWSSIFHYGCDPEVLRKEAPELFAMEPSERRALLQQRYLELGQTLYSKLFAPIAQLDFGSRFVIVPDEGLSYLPFDALLLGAPEIDNFSFYPYLGRDFTLSYAYSGNLLLEMQEGRSTGSQKILAMAPSFGSSKLAMNKSALARLTNNVTEIKAICEIFPDHCTPMEGAAADLKTFRDLVANNNTYRIIHLSTHGKANDKNPNQSWISFTQNKTQLDETQLLYASDLYALSIQADLVVLSACETNKGRLRRGEGIMSFARGFSAAGVKSVLSTFWVIGEDPSLLVMKDFYDQLSAGAATDEALQKARAGLMENSDFSHPFYWSSFVPIGQMSEVVDTGRRKWLTGGMLLLLAFLLLFRFPKSRILQVE